MTLTDAVAKNIIRKLIRGEDYRVEIVTIINAVFLQFVIDFFKKVVNAKLENKDITVDWYKKTFLDPKLPAKEIAINSGLNKKTIYNMYKSSTRQIVLDASNEHYDTLFKAINDLVDFEKDLDLKITIKFNDVGTDLTISESLIVINTLAVKRAEIRGGMWSTAGKRVEKPLMLTLCNLYQVDNKFYAIKMKSEKLKKLDFEREIDFYLTKDNQNYKCEVKLMGPGNTESADAVIARGSRVFIADYLSDTLNTRQLDSLGVLWVTMRTGEGFKRFEKVLEALNIPFTPYVGVIDHDLDKIFEKVFQ